MHVGQVIMNALWPTTSKTAGIEANTRRSNSEDKYTPKRCIDNFQKNELKECTQKRLVHCNVCSTDVRRTAGEQTSRQSYPRTPLCPSIEQNIHRHPLKGVCMQHPATGPRGCHINFACGAHNSSYAVTFYCVIAVGTKH